MEYQLQRENPIAVFDSGVGGISVLRELIRIMPEEDFIYFGDSKNAPYGTCLLYTSPSPLDYAASRMPSSA